jgi:hypothetical protein
LFLVLFPQNVENLGSEADFNQIGKSAGRSKKKLTMQ